MTDLERLREIKPLAWEETYCERGDGHSEVSGWEAENGFGAWYAIEQYFGSDSYGWQAKFDHEIIGDSDDPAKAKSIAQAHYEARIRAALSAPAQASAEEERGWLCELKGQTPSWWRLADEDEEEGWTTDSLRALRFARKSDAQAYIDETAWTEVFPSEHMWLGPRTSSPAPAQGDAEAVAWRATSPTGYVHVSKHPLGRDAYKKAGWEVEPLYASPSPAPEAEKLREALKLMLAHSCVADAGPDMKSEEDHAAERAARAALGDAP